MRKYVSDILLPINERHLTLSRVRLDTDERDIMLYDILADFAHSDSLTRIHGDVLWRWFLARYVGDVR